MTEPTIDPFHITNNTIALIRAAFSDLDGFYTSRCCDRLYFGIEAATMCRTCDNKPVSLHVTPETQDSVVVEYLTK